MKTKLRFVHKKLTIVLTIFLFIGIVAFFLNFYGSSDSLPEYPNYEKKNLEEVLDLTKVYLGYMDEKEKKTLFLQTGLGPIGVEEIRKVSGNKDEFKRYLYQFQEQLFKGEGEKEFVDLKTGDILVSMSQRLCFYPHGHAAIVIDGEKNRILESRSYKAGSLVCKLSKWSNLHSFVVLRVKEEVVKEFLEKGYENPTKSAALYADENLNGLKYSLLKDIRVLNEDKPEYTQCANLVWYAYYKVGLDIDENRGIIVKPKDFLKSEVLEVVQVFGIEPDKLLKMRNE